jgi:hypothetical protein
LECRFSNSIGNKNVGKKASIRVLHRFMRSDPPFLYSAGCAPMKVLLSGFSYLLSDDGMSPGSAINLTGFSAFAPVLNLSGFYKIYDSKPTALFICVAADVGMQIFKFKRKNSEGVQNK